MLQLFLLLVFVYVLAIVLKALYRRLGFGFYVKKHTINKLPAEITALKSAIEKGEINEFARLADKANNDTISRIGFDSDANRQQVESVIKAYAEQRPESASAQYLLGEHLVGEAWRHRGTGVAGTVTTSGWGGFRECLIAAEKYLRRSIELDSNFSPAYCSLIKCYMGRSDRRAAESLFAIASEKFPTDYGIHAAMLKLISAKWLGKADESMNLAKRLDAEHVSGVMAWLICAAYEEAYLDVGDEISWNDYFAQDNRKTEIVRASERYISAKHSVVDELSYLDGLQEFAVMFYQLNNPSDANKIFRQMNGYSSAAWGRITGSRETNFARARRWAGL